MLFIFVKVFEDPLWLDPTENFLDFTLLRLAKFVTFQGI